MPARIERVRPHRAKPAGRSRAAAERAKFYDTQPWRRLSRKVLAAEPLCRDCATAGTTEPATDVDHIVPVAADWSRRFDRGNLRPLCKSCHNRRRREQHP